MPDLHRLHRAHIQRALGLLLVGLMLAPALAPTVAAYPDSVSMMTDGALNRTVVLPYPPVARSAGSIAVLSNATVQSGFATLSGQPVGLPINYMDSATVGFPSGTNSAGLSTLTNGLSLRLSNGSTEFTGTGLDFGVFINTVRTSGGVVLTSTTGNYTSPSIAWNGVSYGRLITDIAPGYGAVTVSFAAVDTNWTVLQSNLLPGQVITVNGSLYPSIRILVTMGAGSVVDSPAIRRIGAGFVIADYMRPTIATRQMSKAVLYGDTLGLPQSRLNFSEYSGNPVLGGTGGTWYAAGPIGGTTVNVGQEIWNFFSSQDAVGNPAIGRMVSTDGAATWTIDASPLLTPTAATWDASYVGIPTVLRTGSGGFEMWYMGGNSADQFRIGYATSADGITWTKSASNPVLANSVSGWDNWNAGWPVVTKVSSTYYMFFSARNSVDARKSTGYATSSDGVSWTKYGGNPVIAYGSTTPGAYEAVAAYVNYNGGTFFLFWMCAASSTAQDTCLSTSTNAIAWTHSAANPIVTHGDGNWDSITAELTFRVDDPLTGRVKMFFSGRPGTANYNYGRFDPNYEGPGNYTSYWDLTEERPHAFISHNLVFTALGGSATASLFQVGATNSSYGGVETLAASDTTIFTAPDHWLKYNVNLSASSDAKASPLITGIRMAYDRYAPAGSFVSAPRQQLFPVRNATVTPTITVPPGTGVQLWVSNDNGTTWLVATPGMPVNFPSLGFIFRYRLALAGTSSLSPTVSSVDAALGLDATPSGVTLRGSSGGLIASVPGNLTSAVTVPLDAAYFNGALAAVASSDPPYLVNFELMVNATTPGVVHLDAVRLNFTVPDLLRATFAPNASSVVVDEGATQSFRVEASTTAGVPITYAWSLDGVATSQTGPTFTYASTIGALGSHTLRAVVTNGQFSLNRTWAISVIAPATYLVAQFYPGVHDIQVPIGLLQQFFASAATTVVAPTITWRLDGAQVAAAPGYNYTAPGSPGAHVVVARVTDGRETIDWQWNVSVTAVPAAPSNQFLLAYAPSANPSVAYGQTADFFANFSGAAPAGVHYEWRMDGLGVGDDSGHLAFTAAAADFGTHFVTVLVRNETAIAAHSWSVNVLPPAPPAAPTVTITSPVDFATVTASHVTVAGTASAGASLLVNGKQVTPAADGTWSVEVTLFGGNNPVVALVTDTTGRTASMAITIRYEPPAEPAPTTSSSTEGQLSLSLLFALIAVAALAALMAILWMRERRGRPPQEGRA